MSFTIKPGEILGYLGPNVAVMLILIVLSFSIRPQTAAALVHPELARWLPPVWFLGLYQSMSGDPDPAMHMLAHRALAALAIAVAHASSRPRFVGNLWLAMLSYQVSYRRHRELLVEGAAGPAKDRRWSGAILDCLIPSPRQQAIVVFMAKTLARSSRHRTILMGYCGFGIAILLSGIIAMPGAVEPALTIPAYFVYAHVILLVFLLIGLRHLFSIPAELKANWTFQITEGEGRREWLRAVDRFVLVFGAVLMLVIPFPAEIRWLGWRAVGEPVLFVAFAPLCYEWGFSSWEKLPFTCSHLPGKTPMWIVALRLLGLLAVVPLVSGLLLVSLYHRVAFLVVLSILLAGWARIRLMRREGWGELRLKYDETPEPAVHALNLLG